METISDRVIEYQRAGRGIDELVDSVCELVYNYPVGRNGFQKEDAAEFLISFYPRIRRLIEKYRPTGSSFESYLAATLRWQLRSFAMQRATERIQLQTTSSRDTATEVAGHGVVADGVYPPPEGAGIGEANASREDDGRRPRTRVSVPPPDRRRKLGAFRPSAVRLEPRGPSEAKLTPGEAQRLLCISLKAHSTVDAELCSRLAPIVGCTPEWLLDRWQQLHEATKDSRERRARIRERRDRAWFRVRCIEARLAEAVPAERDSLLAQRLAWHGRYERARHELRRVPDGPTHEQIADALGIAKGTVDSSVFKVRHELQDPTYRVRLARMLEGP